MQGRQGQNNLQEPVLFSDLSDYSNNSLLQIDLQIDLTGATNLIAENNN